MAKDFTTTVLINALPQEVFNGINNVRGWWSQNIEGRTDGFNSGFIYRDKSMIRIPISVFHFFDK
jgi:hypothetical protein